MPHTDTRDTAVADPATLDALVADALVDVLAVDPDDTSDTGGDGEDGVDLPDGWRGVLAPLGVRSGDGRVIAMPAELRVRQAPVPMRWRERDTMGHDDAVVVSRIDRVWIADGLLWGEGPFDVNAPHYQEAARQLAAGFCNAISVGLDDETIEFDIDEEVVIFSDWRLAEATMVQVGAFDEARIEPVYGYRPTAASHAGEPVMSVSVSAESAEPAVTAAVSGATGLPLGDRAEKWDGGAARRELLAWATTGSGDDAKVDAAKLGKGFFWRDPDADPATLAAYKLPFARPVDGNLRAVWSGVTAAAAALEGSRGGVSIPSGDVAGVRSRVAGYYRAAAKKYDDDTIKPPWSGDTSNSGAALVAAGGDLGSAVVERVRFDRADFDPPVFDGPAAMKVTADGRVFGHLAIWGECHLGVGDTCVMAPKSRTDYAFFHMGEVTLTDGTDLPVGKITLGAGHADPRLGLVPALEHYDNTAAVVAVVRASEDAHGIVVAGRVLPGTSPERVTELQMSPLSGDWRRAGAHLELVAALAVNTPGFPVPRTVAASVGNRQVSLVAAGVVAPVAPSLTPLDIDREVGAALARRHRAAQLARRVGLDPRSRAEALAARVTPVETP